MKSGSPGETLKELHSKMMKLKMAKSPFPKKVRGEALTTWVKPILVAEVKFTEWTNSGEMAIPFIWD
jgi:bifunctional non-homologous end joining protein LigD